MRHARRQQMAARAAETQDKKRNRGLAILSGVAAFSLAGVMVYGGYLLLTHPQTPFPRHWNPIAPLIVSDPVTAVTGWKLDQTAEDAEACYAALAGGAELTQLPPLEDSEQCFIADRIQLTGVGDAAISPLETRCATALRLAMWQTHVVQPAAVKHLGQGVARISHIGSYNCRQMRTSSGSLGRMSTHATADAIDISGFDLADGTRIRLLQDWDGETATAEFLRDVRDGACDWFGLTLSPDFNRLHADHFHLQARGWGGCR